MELIKDTIYIPEIKARGTVQSMADGDVIVPDTKPDILKLIQVDSDAAITDKYIENGRLIICGKVVSKILYVPDSENERIKSISAVMEFRQVIEGGGADSDCNVFATPTVERVEFNTVNSRKLHIRAIVRLEYELCSSRTVEISTDIESEEAEKRRQTVSLESIADISEHDFTIKERLETPSGENSISEVLKCDVKIFDTEYKCVSGKVIVKGCAGVCVLYCDDVGDIKFIEAELPFTEVLDAEGVTETAVCDIDYCVLGVMYTAEPDSDGDLRILTVDIDISAALKATETVEREVLCDCFVPYRQTMCEYEEITLRAVVERPSAQSTIREVIAFPTSVPSVSRVYNVMTNVIMSKTELQRNKIICEGRLEVYILYLTESVENPIYSFKKDIPFSYATECSDSCDNLDCEVKPSVRHISYSLNAGGELEVRCLLAMDSMLVRETTVSNLSVVSTEDLKRRSGIVIYFANEGESVWDIAKHYAVPCSALVENNDLEEDTVSRKGSLFIPTR